jgi:hypothetical protein
LEYLSLLFGVSPADVLAVSYADLLAPAPVGGNLLAGASGKCGT